MPGKVIKTQFGEFKENYYEPVHNMKDQALGVNMFLEFKPGGKVFGAKKIAFAQAVSTKKGKQPKTRTQNEKKEKLVRKGIGAGYYIDQDDHLKNPLYATTRKKDKKIKDPEDKLEGYLGNEIRKLNYSKEDLLSEKISEQLYQDTDFGLLTDRKYAGYGEFGYRYYESTNTAKNVSSTSKTAQLHEKNASIQDTPHFPAVKRNSSQKFETTAVVADGMQKGLFLGSITWGWERTGRKHNDFKKLPMEIKSKGAPSEVFFRSAEKWNKAKTQKDEETIDLPMSIGVVTEDKLKLYENEKDIESNNYKLELSKGTKCRLIKTLGNHLYIRILSSDNNFEEGFVQRIKDGKITVDESQTFLNWPGLKKKNE